MTSKKISLDGTHRQLIEINEDAKYFEATIRITPSKEDFKKKYGIGIVTQEKLDTGVEPTISEISGPFLKTINVTEGDYQSYCLIIKSSQVFTDMNIKIDLEKFDKEEEPTVPETPPGPSAEETHAIMESFIQEKESGNKKIKYIIGGIILLAGVFFLYHFWKSKNTESTTIKDVPNIAQVEVPNVVEIPEILPAPLPRTPISSFSFY